MTVRELYGIFSGSGKGFEFEMYGNDQELHGTPEVYADAKVLFVRDYAIKHEFHECESDCVTFDRYILTLSIEIEV